MNNKEIIDKLHIYKNKYINNKLTIEELSELLGISTNNTISLLMKYNIHKKYDDDVNWDKVGLDYAQNKISRHSISKKYNLSVAKVSLELNKRGYSSMKVHLRNTKQWNSIKAKIKDQHIYKFIYNYFIVEEGTIAALRKETKVTNKFISNILNKSPYPYMYHKYYISKKYLNKYNCDIAENNKNISSKNNIKYTCSNKDHGIQSVNYYYLKNNFKGCKYCMSENYEDIMFNNIKLEFKELGYKLLSDKYISPDYELSFLCKEHGVQNITYANFTKGHTCPECDKYYNIIGDIAMTEKFKNPLRNRISKLYILEFSLGSEMFYNIVVSNSIDSYIINIPYAARIVYSLEDNLYNLSCLKNNLIRYHDKYKYKPVMKFLGSDKYYKNIMLKLDK